MIDVHLVRVEGGNPFFDYPQLQQIWPQPYREAATMMMRPTLIES